VSLTPFILFLARADFPEPFAGLLDALAHSFTSGKHLRVSVGLIVGFSRRLGDAGSLSAFPDALAMRGTEAQLFCLSARLERTNVLARVEVRGAKG
jgi:hypothetical protein